MARILVVVTTIVLCVSLGGCSQDAPEPAQKNSPAAAPAKVADEAADIAAPPAKAAEVEESPTSSPVIVEKKKLTFDPKTCTSGRGLIYGGLGSAAVKVLRHEDGDCVFEYMHEIEMGVTIYLVRVPLDSGPVSVQVDETRTDFTTSFSLDKASILRQGNIHEVGWPL
jgi:hypothetical protein